jgi:predicted GH43/DUF377 family glycosyl hydrolase
VRLKRFEGNPILSPNPAHEWENLAVFNPAVWYEKDKQLVLMLYRAAEAHPEYKCYFGLAVSNDGYHFERVADEPVIGPSVDGFDASTIQDPRMIKMGEWYYITYAARHFPFGQFWKPKDEQYRSPPCPPDFPKLIRSNATSTGLLLTKDFKTFIRAGRITDPLLDDRDVVLFPEKIGGRYVMMHRPLEWVGKKYGTKYASAWISTAEDLLGFRKSKLLIKAKYEWEADKLGINTPPIRTEHGWLTLYHAVGGDQRYRIGALLLDLDDPGQVRHRTPDWIMQSEAEYEVDGYYRGCVFPCGKIIIGETLFVYYGAADKYVCLATCRLAELLDHLLSCPA